MCDQLLERTRHVDSSDTDTRANSEPDASPELSNIAPGKDGVRGNEDVRLDMLTSTLLADDKVLGFHKNLKIFYEKFVAYGLIL